jgi:hypothetical protein
MNATSVEKLSLKTSCIFYLECRFNCATLRVLFETEKSAKRVETPCALMMDTGRPSVLDSLALQPLPSSTLGKGHLSNLHEAVQATERRQQPASQLVAVDYL